MTPRPAPKHALPGQVSLRRSPSPSSAGTAEDADETGRAQARTARAGVVKTVAVAVVGRDREEGADETGRPPWEVEGHRTHSDDAVEVEEHHRAHSNLPRRPAAVLSTDTVRTRDNCLVGPARRCVGAAPLHCSAVKHAAIATADAAIGHQRGATRLGMLLRWEATLVAADCGGGA